VRASRSRKSAMSASGTCREKGVDVMIVIPAGA
jgi:hypothetical protein